MRARRVLTALLALLAGGAVALSAQVAFDRADSTSGNASSFTLAHTTGAGSSRLLVVSVAIRNGNNTVQSVTYGGTGLTFLAANNNSDNAVRLELWYLKNPTSGAASVAVNLSGGAKAAVGAVTYSGVNQITPFGTVVRDSSTGTGTTNPSVTVSSTSGDMVMDAIASEGAAGTWTAGAGQTRRWYGTTGSSGGDIAGVGSTEAGATSVTMSWTKSGTAKWAILAVPIQSAAVTTLGTGTDPANASLGPGGAATMADAFTVQTNTGTDAITAVTVTLATGTSGGLSLVEITNDAGTVVYGSASNPASDTPAISLSTSITATTTSTQYKIRVTPKSHAAMPAPAGSTYSVTARLSAWTSSNTQAGSDAAGTTVTIDNLSPGNVTSSTATAGVLQVALAWTNPGDGDLGTIIVLRRAGTAVGDTPTEGSTYSIGNTIGSSTVACVVSAPTASCTDGGLTGGTAYHYKVFSRDANGNYSTGAVPSGSPATPLSPPAVNLTNAVSPNGTQPPGTDLAYTISFSNTGGAAATSVVIVDSLKTNVDFKVGSVTSSLGSTGLTVVVAYSNNGGSTFTYTPASGGGGAPAGYDRTVTHVRWTFTGSLSQTAPNNAASVGLTARIR